MKGLKLAMAAIGFAAATGSVNAATTEYVLNGDIVSYAVRYAGSSVDTISVFDAVTPGLAGRLQFSDSGLGQFSAGVDFGVNYFNAVMGSVVKTTPKSALVAGGGGVAVGDGATGHYRFTVAGTYRTTDSFCTGAAIFCSVLYRDGNDMSSGGSYYSMLTGTLDLYFDALGAFTGTLTEHDLLSDSSVITRTYTLSGYEVDPVPIPLSGVLFGSSLLALAGIGRHRRR